MARPKSSLAAPNRASKECAVQMASGILEPSVAQPPLPLQLFLPLQPLSPDLHPPWPLQSFLPLQECLAVSWPV